MSELIVRGGKPISGEIKPFGNKNAVLPMLCASLLTDDATTIENVPEISDVEKILDYFRRCGSDVSWDRDAGTISVRHDLAQLSSAEAELPLGIRSAVLLLAPVITRAKKLFFDTDAKGCALGLREIDPHLHILSRFGCTMRETRPYRIEGARVNRAQHIWADYASVTATETFLMMAATAEGVSTLTNAASEPHVQALCRMLEAMGAKIEGIGTSRLTVTGVSHLSGASVVVPDDHHEVATFLAIGGVTGGRISVRTDVTEHMVLIIRQFQKLGLQITEGDGVLTVDGWNREIERPYTVEMLQKIEAAPWPYFPADLLPQAIGVSIGCTGDIMFWNKIYEGALGWSAELNKFGAKVHLSDPHRLIVFGGTRLRPAIVEAPYIIRVVLALFIAAIQIDGESIIKNADPIRRAHPKFVERLKELGAEVEWR
ncbi:MAG: UDP-N-acetylglucosamine 1-carboxyvinyltransferase [Pseudomonadota bacterium]|nr:UDP-N-acetylglucosamine 1-carboxyvinyltransferase [Pseudomonadota bacterium]